VKRCAAGYVQEPPRKRHDLDRVERGEQPLHSLGLTDRIARHQDFALAGEMQQPGPLARSSEPHVAHKTTRPSDIQS
jgi:hypothetical protein